MIQPLHIEYTSVFTVFPFSSTNGKHKDWDDVLTHEDAASDLNVPLLVIGTKQDLESNLSGSLPVHQKRSHVAEDYGTEEIHLNCTDTKSTVPGSSASNKLSRFFDKVSRVSRSMFESFLFQALFFGR